MRKFISLFSILFMVLCLFCSLTSADILIQKHTSELTDVLFDFSVFNPDGTLFGTFMLGGGEEMLLRENDLVGGVYSIFESPVPEWYVSQIVVTSSNPESPFVAELFDGKLFDGTDVGLPGARGVAVEQFFNDRNTVTFTNTPVPEPTTMLLLGTGLAGLIGLGRKKFFKKK